MHHLTQQLSVDDMKEGSPMHPSLLAFVECLGSEAAKGQVIVQSNVFEDYVAYAGEDVANKVFA